MVKHAIAISSLALLVALACTAKPSAPKKTPAKSATAPLHVDVERRAPRRFGGSELIDRFGRPIRVTSYDDGSVVYVIGDGPEAFTLAYASAHDEDAKTTADSMIPDWWDGGSP